MALELFTWRKKMRTHTYGNKNFYYPEMSDLVGKVFTSVTLTEDTMVFENDTEKFTFEHDQDCCESVWLEDVCGDIDDLVGEPLLLSEEVSNYDAESLGNSDESYTWTFYKFATRKGYVDVRWYGTSNGYYSESVDLKYEVKNAN